MEVDKFKAWLEKTYPGAKRIVCNGARQAVGSSSVVGVQADEMVAEFEDGRAIAVVERSIPHFHLVTVETYRILEGRLAVIVAGLVVLLDGPGRSSSSGLEKRTGLEIQPGAVHSAVSVDGGPQAPAVVEIRSSPPWNADDHFEV